MTKTIKQWKHTQYKVLSLSSIRDFSAIFFQQCEDGSGDYYLDQAPCLLAVAEVTRRIVQGIPGRGRPQELSREVSNEIVGVMLDLGLLDVCNECNNYAGLCGPLDDPFQHLGCMPYELYKRLRQHPEYVPREDGQKELTE